MAHIDMGGVLQSEALEELVQVLLADNSTMVLGSAVAAYNEVHTTSICLPTYVCVWGWGGGGSGGVRVCVCVYVRLCVFVPVPVPVYVLCA